jgi:hypothetical protein
LGKNFNNSLKFGANFFLQHFKNIIFNFVKFVAQKKYDKNFLSPLSFVAVFAGSGMGKKSGSGINIPDPQHWFIYFYK